MYIYIYSRTCSGRLAYYNPTKIWTESPMFKPPIFGAANSLTKPNLT